MSKYDQYLLEKQKRDQDTAERESFYATLSPEVVREIESREDQDTKLKRRGKSSVKSSEVLLILERYGVDVTESLFNTVDGIYK